MWSSLNAPLAYIYIMSLSEEEIENLWQAYLEHPSAYYVSKKCKVSRATVGKYCDSEHWDDRLQKIVEKACAIVADDDDIAQQRATDVEMVHDIKMKVAAAIEKQLESGDYKPTIRDYERLVKLEQFLKEAPDSRREHALSFEWLDNEAGGKTLSLTRLSQT